MISPGDRVRILVAPDKFKGTFTAREACDLLAQGIAAAAPHIEITTQPMADGGEGTLDVALEVLGGEKARLPAEGPFGDPLEAPAGRLKDGTALLESAAFLGERAARRGQRDPLAASSFGLGAGVAAALSWRPAFLRLGLGGTLTMDGGLGLARALGFGLRDVRGRALKGRGADTVVLHAVEPPARPVNPERVPLVGLADVESPLCGENGAARTFAAQKGAGPDGLRYLERGLENLARVLERDLGRQVADIPGGGAAGGLGAAVLAFLDGGLVHGGPAVGEMVGLEEKMTGVDLVVTGEGAFDSGHRGKAAEWICRRAAALYIPVVVVCGKVRGELPGGDVEFMVSGAKLSAETLFEAGKGLARKRFFGNGPIGTSERPIRAASSKSK